MISELSDLVAEAIQNEKQKWRRLKENNKKIRSLGNWGQLLWQPHTYVIGILKDRRTENV